MCGGAFNFPNGSPDEGCADCAEKHAAALAADIALFFAAPEGEAAPAPDPFRAADAPPPGEA